MHFIEVEFLQRRHADKKCKMRNDEDNDDDNDASRSTIVGNGSRRLPKTEVVWLTMLIN